MSRDRLPPIGDDLSSRRKVDLKALRSGEADDAVIEANSRKIGAEWGAQTSLPTVSEETPPKVPLASLRIEVPDYLDRELAFKAVEMRTTKQYLVVKALRDAGYTVHESDLVEDRRRAKKR